MPRRRCTRDVIAQNSVHAGAPCGGVVGGVPGFSSVAKSVIIP